MDKKLILAGTGLSILMLLTGCGKETSSYNAGTESEVTAEISTIEETDETENLTWKYVEWKDVVLQLPVGEHKTYNSEIFQSTDQTGELAGLALVTNTWQDEWNGGSYQLEYFEIMVDEELATMINLHHADQIINEYLSFSHSSESNIGDTTKELLRLGDESCQRVIKESEIYDDDDGKLQKRWEYRRDAYNRWRLTVTVQKESATNSLAYIDQSFKLNELPQKINKDQVISMGDLEIQIPFELNKKTENERFREADSEDIDYLYTVNSWEGELDGNTCILTYESVYSDEDVISNRQYTGHLRDSHYGQLYYTKQLPEPDITYTNGERIIVREDGYPKYIYKSFGYTNDEEKPMRSWQYTNTPYDMWMLKIIASEEQADEIFDQVDASITLKKE